MADVAPQEASKLRATSKDDAATWQTFREQFEALAEKELVVDPGNRADRWLRAYLLSTEQAATLGLWQLSEGINEGFKERWSLLATKAGIAVGPPAGTKPLDYWLHQIYTHLFDHRSKLLQQARKESGIIRRVSEGSAILATSGPSRVRSKL